MSNKESAGSAPGGAVMQRRENSLYPPYNTLPESPNRWWGWYSMLNAIEYSPLHGISRLEDELVPLKPLDNFVPEPQRIIELAECRIVIVADAFHKRPEILQGIQMAVPPERTITHETTHIVSRTYDIVRYGLTSTGFLLSGQNVTDDFLARYVEYFEPPNFDQFVTAVARKKNDLGYLKKLSTKHFKQTLYYLLTSN